MILSCCWCCAKNGRLAVKRFKAVANRVGASHTYRLLTCPLKGADISDEESLSQAEAASLHAMMPVLKKARKQFANSSGLQQFLQQLN